jgi:hypothetical protein
MGKLSVDQKYKVVNALVPELQKTLQNYTNIQNQTQNALNQISEKTKQEHENALKKLENERDDAFAEIDTTYESETKYLITLEKDLDDKLGDITTKAQANKFASEVKQGLKSGKAVPSKGSVEKVKNYINNLISDFKDKIINEKKKVKDKYDKAVKAENERYNKQIKTEKEPKVEEAEEKEERIVKSGSGIESDEEGLYSDEIQDIMGKYESFIGVFADDQYKEIVAKVKPKSRGSVIVNTDPSTKSGSHWQAIYWDARSQGSKSIEFFDSFGRDPSPNQLKGIKMIVEKLKPDTYLKLKINRIKQQDVNSANCGWFCIRFLIDRYRGQSFASSTGYDEKIIEASKKGELEINKFKKSYGGSFNYI